MKIKNILIVIIVLVGVAAGAKYFLFKKESSSKDEVKIISPQYGSIQTVITTTATVLPKNRLAVRPPVNGRVEQILVKEGDIVKSGQILAWMSSTDRAALLDSARGQGEKEYEHWQNVYKPIPLFAPIDAQVIVATIQPGQTVTSIDAIVVLSDRLIIRAQVDETDIGKIKVGQDVVVSLDAYAESNVKGKVDHIYYESSTISNVTMYNVDLFVEDLPVFFRSGMNANVDFIIEKKDNILLLPVSAILQKEDGSFVSLEAKDKSKPVTQRVQTGISDDKNIEIVSGLSQEDKVIIKEEKYSLNKFKSGSNPFMATGAPRSGTRSSGGSSR